MDEIGLDPGFLPGLQELVSDFNAPDAVRLFESFAHARRVAGRPILLSFPRSRTSRGLNTVPVPLLGGGGEERKN